MLAEGGITVIDERTGVKENHFTTCRRGDHPATAAAHELKREASQYRVNSLIHHQLTSLSARIWEMKDEAPVGSRFSIFFRSTLSTRRSLRSRCCLSESRSDFACRFPSSGVGLRLDAGTADSPSGLPSKPWVHCLSSRRQVLRISTRELLIFRWLWLRLRDIWVNFA